MDDVQDRYVLATLCVCVCVCVCVFVSDGESVRDSPCDECQRLIQS